MFNLRRKLIARLRSRNKELMIENEFLRNEVESNRHKEIEMDYMDFVEWYYTDSNSTKTFYNNGKPILEVNNV